jgi:ketosteroid isomerase-like protein
MMSDDPAASPEATVARYFAAMRRGAEAEDEMMSLFTDDAEYVEPFSGEPRTAIGKDAIRSTLRAGWEQPLPDMTLTVQRIEINGTHVTSTWTCTSPVFSAPMRGTDRYEIVDGKIARLVVELDGPPSASS